MQPVASAAQARCLSRLSLLSPAGILLAACGAAALAAWPRRRAASGLPAEGPPAGAGGAHHAERARQLDHDLRTPIGTLVSALSLLQQPDTPEPVRQQALQVMARQLNRLTMLTDGLHDFARDLDPPPARARTDER